MRLTHRKERHKKHHLETKRYTREACASGRIGGHTMNKLSKLERGNNGNGELRSKLALQSFIKMVRYFVSYKCGK